MLWIGTFGGGVDRFSRSKHKFTLYRHDPVDVQSLDNNTVFPIYEDRRGTLWVGTLGGALNEFNAERTRVVARHLVGSGLTRPLAMLEDDRGRFWVGTAASGLLLFDRDSGQVTRRWVNDPDDPDSLGFNSVSGLLQDSRGRLWASGGHFSAFDPDTGTFRNYLHDPDDPSSLPQGGNRRIHEDRNGTLWITSFGGLSRFHRERETFSHYGPDPANPDSLSHSTVMGLFEDDDGFFWLTTYGGGLNRFDPRTGKAESFTTKHGLPSDALYGILPDDHGNLWLSSNGGLVKLDPRTMEFTTYTMADGLQSNEFNGHSYVRTGDGELFFGGVNGLNSFYPDSIQRSDYSPPMAITSLIRSDRREKLPSAGAGDEAQVVVSYKDNAFSFEFASLDYASPERNLYAYKLEGFDAHWIEAGSRRFAGYTNLDGGEYVFRVRGTNSDGVWNEEGTSIRVLVTTPPWKTWWAYCLYLLTAVAAVLAYVRHKTAAHKLEIERQREEAARLRQIDRMKDELLANTSHELRTPLNGIIGITQSLLDGATGPLEEPTRDNLSMVVSSGRRLAHLVDDILDFSKLRKHQIELRRAAVDLRPLVDEVLGLSRPLLSGKSLELVSRVPHDLPLLDADTNRLQQIFHNVIGNALKFTEDGEVAVSAHTVDDGVEITVSDTGIGIPADQLDRIFESFAQADGSTGRTFGGTGLGLTITRRLVELHGGTIRLESDVGEGTRVHFTIPAWSGDGPREAAPSEVRRPGTSLLSGVRDLEPAQPVTLAPSQAETGHAGGGNGQGVNVVGANGNNGNGARVLIVDDEPINLQVLRNILSLEGFHISQAIDGRQCLAQLHELEQPPPDIILLDVMMPGMTGFEVTQQIRAEYSANDLPIVLVTAKNQVSDLEQGLASGANDYLTKPFSRNELLARMRMHLSLARAHTLEAEHRRRSKELEQARNIQLSLLPEVPPRLPYLDVAAHMETATEVGGDYYDFFVQDDGGLYVVTGDATGHGISAGMVVSMTKSALKALDVQSPHILLHQLNQVLRAVKLKRMQMALNVTFVTETELAISSAAMPPSYLYRPGAGVQEILLPGIPLGGLRQAEYQLRVLDFRPGDVLLQISDGLPECLNGAREMLGYEAVADCLSRHGERPAADILEALLELGRSWAGARSVADDITIVVLKRR